jgi:hypothetical protein
MRKVFRLSDPITFGVNTLLSWAIQYEVEDQTSRLQVWQPSGWFGSGQQILKAVLLGTKIRVKIRTREGQKIQTLVHMAIHLELTTRFVQAGIRVNRGRDFFNHWVHIHVASDSPNPKALLAPLNQHGTDILITKFSLRILNWNAVTIKIISILNNLIFGMVIEKNQIRNDATTQVPRDLPSTSRGSSPREYRETEKRADTLRPHWLHQPHTDHTRELLPSLDIPIALPTHLSNRLRWPPQSDWHKVA